MIWATVSSLYCFCWLYRAFLSLTAKKHNQSDFSIDHPVMSVCRDYYVAGSSKNQEHSKKATTFALLTTPKTLTVYIKTNCGKFFKRWEYQTTWPASWEIHMEVKKQQLELDMDNRLVPNQKRSMSRLYIVNLLINNLYSVTSREMLG